MNNILVFYPIVSYLIWLSSVTLYMLLLSVKAGDETGVRADGTSGSTGSSHPGSFGSSG